MDRILAFILVALEARGLSYSLPRRRWMSLAFYTQVSNLVCTASVFFLLILGHQPWIASLRYLSTCMLILTFLVTLFVLIPMGGDPNYLLFTGNGPYHHLLCPIIGTISYIFFEHHCGPEAIWLPVIVTFVYGLILFTLNALRIVDGPYPFLRVHNQSIFKTVFWAVALLAITAGISYLVYWIAH